MKLVKSLLLGSAAGFAAVAGAQAADLPSRKAAPVEYVRVCSAYGAGFFYIPGTDTCLRVSGRVRAEYVVGKRFGTGQDGYGTRARGQVNFDARTATAYGTLRTFIRYQLNNNGGQYAGSNVNGILFPGARTTNSSDALLDLAFVQFGPITAGRAQSFFDFYANDYGFNVVRTSDNRLNLLAYTATFGSGFSLTVSAEDRSSGTANREAGAVTRFGAAGVTLAGQEWPDVVASLRVDQGWGSAQLSGAIAQRKVNIAQNAFLARGGDHVGFAVQGGVKINLPFLAAGDALFLQAAYADGAVGYLGYSTNFGLGRFGPLVLGDISVDPVSGKVSSTKGYSFVAALRHYWTPQLRSEVYGSYSKLDLRYTHAAAFYAGPVRSLDPKELRIGANLIWSPVAGLDIGVDVLYQRVELATRFQTLRNDVTRTGAFAKSQDGWVGRLRIQRDF
jgi:hypothetical protein